MKAVPVHLGGGAWGAHQFRLLATELFGLTCSEEIIDRRPFEFFVELRPLLVAY